MARVALGWCIRDLASEAELTPPMVTQFETGSNVTVEKILRSLDRAAITCVTENVGATGVMPPRHRGDKLPR